MFEFLKSYVSHFNAFLLIYLVLIIPLFSWEISRSYLKFKESEKKDQEKLCRKLVGEVLFAVFLSCVFAFTLFSLKV